jgi:hypothetical protein
MIIVGRLGALCAGIVAAGIFLSAPSIAPAASFGYGDFLGEFPGNLNGNVTELLGNSVEQIAHWDGSSQGDLDFSITAFKEGEPIGGEWLSLDGPSSSMILAVKYGRQFSLFRYPNVETGDDGLFASDPVLTGFPMSTNGNGQPFAISNIRAYSVVPLPPTLLLLATAIAAVVGFARATRVNALGDSAR